MSTFNVPPTLLNPLLEGNREPLLNAIKPQHDCLSLIGRRLKADDLEHIASIIPNAPFERILLAYNQIGIYSIPHSHQLWNIPKLPTRTGAEPNGLNILGSAICNSHIKVVDLSHNRLSGAMLADFIATLKGSKVTHLILANNQLGIHGVCEVIHACNGTNITSLDVSGNGISIPDAHQLYQALDNTNITRFIIDKYSPRAIEAIQKVLAKNQAAMDDEKPILNQFSP